jgi:hypothetical protein
MADSLGQLEIQQERKEEEEAGHFGCELPSILKRQGLDVGDVRYNRTVVCAFTR